MKTIEQGYRQYLALWSRLYSGSGEGEEWLRLAESLWDEARNIGRNARLWNRKEEGWYENAVVYALYVQHFNRDFAGLISRLDYLSELGITCIWLLPILESPMRDEGFDISDYYRIRPSLFPEGSDAAERDAASRVAIERIPCH